MVCVGAPHPNRTPMSHDKAASSSMSSSSSSSLSSDSCIADQYGVITREGSASNGGWFEVQLDGGADRKVYYRRGSICKLKQPTPQQQPHSHAQHKGKASHCQPLHSAAIPAHPPAAALHALPAQMPAAATLVQPVTSFLVQQQTQPLHTALNPTQLQAYAPPPSPLYVTCLPSHSQSLTPLSLPTGGAPPPGSFVLSNAGGLEALHCQPQHVYVLQSPSPQLVPTCPSPSSATSTSSAMSSSGSSFVFAGGRRASTGSLMEPLQQQHSSVSFASSSPSPRMQPTLAPILAVAQPTRAQMNGGHPGGVTSPPILVLHSPPLVSLRATSTPVQLYQQQPPPQQLSNGSGFMQSQAAPTAFVALHPSSMAGGGFDTSAAGRASAFTSVGSFAAPLSMQPSAMAPPSPSSMAGPTPSLVTPRALRLSHHSVAPLSLPAHPPAAPVVAAASLPLHALSLSSSVSAPPASAAFPTRPSTSRPSSPPAARSTASAFLHASNSPPQTPLASTFQAQAMESNKKRRRSIMDVDVDMTAHLLHTHAGAGDESMVSRTSSLSSVCHPSALLPVSLCQSVALCSL